MAEPVTEDTNLDDFFAKKDKTKKKSKSRLTPADIETQMEKKLKKKTTAIKKKEKDSANSAQSSVLDVKLEEDDGEWKDAEEETAIDYSDLRIQNLKISSKEEDDKDRQDNYQSGEEGDERIGKDGPQGPWKSMQANAAAAAVAASAVAAAAAPPDTPPPAKETVAPAEPGKDAAATAPQKYVPPGARRAAAAGGSTSSGTGSGPGGRRKKVAPNFNSQDDFPSLGATNEQGDSTGAEYEKVRGGGRQIEDPSNRHVKLSLGNKYGALEGKDS